MNDRPNLPDQFSHFTWTIISTIYSQYFPLGSNYVDEWLVNKWLSLWQAWERGGVHEGGDG